MEITAKITGIEYSINLSKQLKLIDYHEFDINKCPSSCLVAMDNNLYALSKWVSPKRTRTYPYERVYNTLIHSKKITVIPILKDEGADGDRDFIQWDTISLMSLLDVYVILAYYSTAERNKIQQNKITKQKFDNDYIQNRISEIENYHSSALHWNLKEINSNLSLIIQKAKQSYSKIENKLNVKFHSESGLDNFINRIKNEANLFMNYSRNKAEEAQNRELTTIQPKESLITSTKAKITITNYLGGMYFLTVDEVEINRNIISLIESKHTKSSKLPSLSDIKDGLIKMILFSNLKNVKVNNHDYNSSAVLQLTSLKIIGSISSKSSQAEILNFFQLNKFNDNQIKLVKNLFFEASKNNFNVLIRTAADL